MKKIEEKSRFIELRAKGYSLARIASELGVSKQTLINWQKEFCLEISNMRALEHEALLEQHKLSLRARTELFGEFLSKVREAVNKTDLSSLPPAKLFDLYAKMLAANLAQGFSRLRIIGYKQFSFLFIQN